MERAANLTLRRRKRSRIGLRGIQRSHYRVSRIDADSPVILNISRTYSCAKRLICNESGIPCQSRHSVLGMLIFISDTERSGFENPTIATWYNTTAR